MTDIDFEELDRAVNSLMNQRQQATTPGPKVSGSMGESEAAAPSAEEAVASTATPNIRRSSGRFMDVVAPGSKAGRTEPSTPLSPRTGVTLQPITQTPSIDGVVTRPHTAAATPPVTASAVSVSSSSDAPDGIAQATAPSANLDEDRIARMTDEIAASLAGGSLDGQGSLTADSSNTVETTDAVDMAEVMAVEAIETGADLTLASDAPSSTDMVETQQPSTTIAPSDTGMPAAPPVDSISVDSAEAAPALVPESTEPLNSPFLENPTVEKRPLGGYADTAPETTDVLSVAPVANESAISELTEPDAANPVEGGEGRVVQPSADVAPEFDQTLMALESTVVEPLPEPAPAVASSVDEAAAPSKPPTTAQEIFAAPIDSIDEFAVGDLDQKMERAIAKPEAPAAAQSNPSARRQQPLEAPKPEPTYGDDDDLSPEPLPMFDAASEQPVSPAKRSSAASTFLVILLLLLIGAGGGVAAYYFLLVQ